MTSSYSLFSKAHHGNDFTDMCRQTMAVQTKIQVKRGKQQISMKLQSVATCHKQVALVLANIYNYTTIISGL